MGRWVAMGEEMSVDSCCKFDKTFMERPKINFKIKVRMNSDTIITLHIAHFSKMKYIKFVNYNVNINFLNYYISEYLKIFPCIIIYIYCSIFDVSA